ncbi:hypothetical protein ABZY93_23315 [Streptomyces smyrnaeus]|uniref:hypothetical protein n=1 Tax=Streptomyces smyrnaeus TaxID=1387713 RepID=UPI0033B487AF
MVDRTTPTLSNTVTDPDGDDANLTFQVYTVDSQGKPKDQVDLGGEYGVVVSDFVASGKRAKAPVPYGKLDPGTTYVFRSSAYDGGLYETDWSSWKKFTIRNRAVDIKLPEPNPDAPKVDLDHYQKPQTARRNIPEPTPPLRSQNALPAPLGEDCKSIGGGKIHCMTVGKPGDLTKKQQAQVDKRVSARAGDDLVGWCDGLTGKDFIKRTEACLKKAPPIESTFYRTINGNVTKVGSATFASQIQMKLDPASTSFQQRFWLVPVEFKHYAGPKEWGPLTMRPEFTCTPQCTTSSPEWSGSKTWTTTGSDMHTSYVTYTHKALGTDTNDVASVQMRWDIGGWVPESTVKWDMTLGTSTPDIDVRCDKVAAPTKPGCVFSEYKPTWVMNFKKYPAAVAHAWLIQSKLPNHPGSKTADKPMKYLPQASKNAHNRNPRDNGDVICPKDSDGKSWARVHGNPDTTLLPEIKPKDVPSCDEFAYAATYNSGGMPASMGGLNEVSSGDECVQSYATRAKQGEWHLYDDTRQAAPTWKEVCGRSAMSSWLNSGSMAGFPGNFAAAGKYHLLDEDEYWVSFPEFGHCAAGKATVKCTVPKP